MLTITRCFRKSLISATFIFVAAVGMQAQSLDAFNPNVNGTVNEIELLPDGKMFIGGNFTTVGGVTRNSFARLNADGTLDATFPNVTTFDVQEIIVQPDGKILISGSFSLVNGVTRNRVARLNADGTLDTSFDCGFVPPVSAGKIALQPDGKVIIPLVFSALSITVQRRNADCSADSSFAIRSFNASIPQVLLQPDGKVLAIGGFTEVDGNPRRGIARLNANGTLDNTFNMITDGSVFRASLAADGKIYAGGRYTTVSGQPRTHFARLNTDGSLDTAFQTPTILHPTMNAAAVFPSVVLPDGRVVIGGSFDRSEGWHGEIWRYSTPMARSMQHSGI